MHVNQNQFVLDHEPNSTDVDIDPTNDNTELFANAGREIVKPLTRSTPGRITDCRSYANDFNTPMNNTLEEAQDVSLQTDLISCLNIPAPFEEFSTKQNVTVIEMINLYENEDSMV